MLLAKCQELPSVAVDQDGWTRIDYVVEATGISATLWEKWHKAGLVALREGDYLGQSNIRSAYLRDCDVRAILDQCHPYVLTITRFDVPDRLRGVALDRAIAAAAKRS
jgi:precorrin-6x reductase